MIELLYLMDMNKVKSLPEEGYYIEYGANRDKYEDDGRYIVVVEK